MSCLTRRHFLQSSLALAGIGLAAGCGQPSVPWQPAAKVPQIGYLAAGSRDGVVGLEAFLEGLRELGYVEGQNLLIEWRFAEGNNARLPDLGAELVRLRVDLIVAASPQAVDAARQATSTIPIVMAPYAGDPVQDGMVAGLAHPGGNITGLINFGVPLAAKRLELLKEAVPTSSDVDVLWDATNRTSADQLTELQDAAPKLGVRLRSVEIRTPADLPAAFEVIRSGPARALVAVASGRLINPSAAAIAEFAVGRRLPTISQERSFAEAGGLLAYGPNLADLRRRAATYVDKILKGAKPADLPVELPTTFDFVINLKTAQALGLTIPPSVLQQATEIIQ